MSAKRAEKSRQIEKTRQTQKSRKTTEDTLLALHQDGLSRVFALTGLPHLSTRQSKLFRHTLSGSRVEHRRAAHSPNDASARPRSSSPSEDSLGLLPIWNKIHNRRCSNCDNPLFLGLNASSKKNGQVQCSACKAYIEREEPNKEVKRLFRSVRTRQSSKRMQRQTTEGSKRNAAAEEKMEEDVNDKVAKEPKIPPKEVKGKTLLQQRAAELKRNSKEKKKAHDGKGETIEDVKQAHSGTETSAEVTTRSKDKEKQDSIGLSSKRKQQSSGKQDEALRQMLAQKRAKRQEQANSSSQDEGRGGGLQDFLSNL